MVTDYKIILGHVMYFVLYDSELWTNLANGWLFWVASPIIIYYKALFMIVDN